MIEFINKDVVNIDVDLIRDLKRRGKTIEAYEILRNYRQQSKNNISRLKREELNKTRRIKLFKGFCGVENCFNPIYKSENNKNKSFCEFHYNKSLKYRETNRIKTIKKKLLGVTK